MKNFFITLLTILLLFISLSSQAASYVCPGSYQTVMTGYSKQQVEAACGKPSNVTTQHAVQEKPIEYKQWVYTAYHRGTHPTQLTPQLLITFKDQHVVQIQTSNVAANTLFFCFRTGRIKVGDKAGDVRQACGHPTYINTIQSSHKKRVTITKWTYNFGAYKPQMIFTFHDGKLENIAMGQMGH